MMTRELDKLQISKRLEDARREIGASLRLRDQVCIEQSAEAMDQAQAAEARELAISNLDRSARWLREIDDALRRVADGEYGTCSNCEKEVEPKRLRAVPWARFCLMCQELADQTESCDVGHHAAESFLSAA